MWPGAGIGSQVSLDSIVVTPALRLWHTFHTLALVYRDAYNSQLNDRYGGRCTEYKGLAKWASDVLFRNGIGIAADPIPIAAVPTLGSVSGPLSETTYFVQVSWMNSTGEEGMPSRLASLIVPDQAVLQVARVERVLEEIERSIVSERVHHGCTHVVETQHVESQPSAR